MDRITKKRLQTRIDTLNSMTGQPMEAYAKDETGEYIRKPKGLVPCPGHYHLDSAYGGVAVDQMAEGGGVRVIIDRGTNRAVWDQLGAMIEGIRIGQKTAPPVHIVAAAPNCPNGNPRRVSVSAADYKGLLSMSN
jgi:hypothetical protein